MQLAARPWTPVGIWTTTGIAIVGTSLIAVTPVTPALPDVQSPAVQLTAADAGIDLLAPVLAQFNTLSANVSDLTNNFNLAPFVGMQQAIVNQAGYAQELINNPSSFSDVFTDIGKNAQTVLSSFFLAGASPDTIAEAIKHTLNSGHSLLHSALTGALAPLFPAPDAPIPEIVNLLSSPASGVLIGDLGPFISPDVSLLNSIEAIAGALQGGNPSAALQDLVAAPANLVGSVFNGATINLDPLIPLVEQANIIPLPPGVSVDGLSFAFGGLFTGGEVAAGPYTGAAGDIVPVGGSIFNSLGLDLTGVPAFGDLDTPGVAVGPLGALEGLSQLTGVQLGDGWDGKGAAQLPPLSGLTLPTFNLNDMLPSAAAADLTNIVPADLANMLPSDLLGSFNVGDLASLPQEVITAVTGLF